MGVLVRIPSECYMAPEDGVEGVMVEWAEAAILREESDEGEGWEIRAVMGGRAVGVVAIW